MDGSDFNLITPINSLQNLNSMSDIERRKERKRREKPKREPEPGQDKTEPDAGVDGRDTQGHTDNPLRLDFRA